MPHYTDQTGNTIQLASRPKRIISLVPSQSEFLWELGLRGELVGITKFCIHPQEMFRSVERVGGTKQLNLDKIRALAPDLIIGNKEENEKAQIEQLQAEFPVWMSDIYTLKDAFEMMQRVGKLVNKEAQTHALIGALKQSLAVCKDFFTKQRVAYFIWNKPYMLAAKHTFIHEMLTHLGLENAAQDLERYPEVNAAQLKALDPGVCFLSSEPFPFKQKQVEELKAILPNAEVLIVDGEVFSWYGTHLAHLKNYVHTLPLSHRAD